MSQLTELFSERELAQMEVVRAALEVDPNALDVPEVEAAE